MWAVCNCLSVPAGSVGAAGPPASRLPPRVPLSSRGLIRAARHKPFLRVGPSCSSATPEPLLHNRYGIKMIEQCVLPLQVPTGAEGILDVCSGKVVGGWRPPRPLRCPSSQSLRHDSHQPLGPSWLLANPSAFMAREASFACSPGQI